MRLRSLYEGLGQEVAIIFGRFNPPHKGHRAAWELAAKSPVWYVGTNESTVGPKDPLPYGVKVEAMTAIWPEVEGHIIAETSWLTLASLVYEKHGDVTLLCLTDEDWVTKTIVQYNGKEGAHGFYKFKNIKQKPTPRLSSATALRDAVTKGDREAFAAAAGVDADTPVAGKPFFDLVAEYLLPYSNAPVKKTAKKKVATPVEGIEESQLDELLDPSSVTAKALRYIGRKFSQAFPWLAVGGVGAGLAATGLLAPLVASVGGVTSAIAALSGETMAYVGAGALAGTPSLIQAVKDLFAADENSIQAGIKRWVEKHVGDENDVAEFMLLHAKSAYLGKSQFRWRAKEWPVKLKTSDAEAYLEKHDKSWLDLEKEKASNTQPPNKEMGDFKKEDAAGVGIITKQNSTVDVNKGTPRKNLKAFRLVK